MFFVLLCDDFIILKVIYSLFHVCLKWATQFIYIKHNRLHIHIFKLYLAQNDNKMYFYFVLCIKSHAWSTNLLSFYSKIKSTYDMITKCIFTL